jgi:hypothetical protein
MKERSDMMEVTLGKLLAYMDVEKRNKTLTPEMELPEHLERSLKDLRERFTTLISQEQKKKEFIKIPQHSCDSSAPFLANNEDFFLMMILLYNREEEINGSTDKFIKHLNECYWCFEIYQQVMRDYFHTLQILDFSNN